MKKQIVEFVELIRESSIGQYYLWIDDQLTDPDTPERWTPDGFVGASSSAEAKKIVSEYGLPMLIDFDHDLGEGDTAISFINWMVYWALDNGIDWVPEYKIHSANPPGRANIASKMESWKQVIS